MVKLITVHVPVSVKVQLVNNKWTVMEFDSVSTEQVQKNLDFTMLEAAIHRRYGTQMEIGGDDGDIVMLYDNDLECGKNVRYTLKDGDYEFEPA